MLMLWAMVALMVFLFPVVLYQETTARKILSSPTFREEIGTFIKDSRNSAVLEQSGVSLTIQEAWRGADALIQRVQQAVNICRQMEKLSRF